MNKNKIHINQTTEEEQIIVRRLKAGAGLAAVAVGGIVAAKIGMGSEASPAPELPHHTDKQVNLVIKAGDSVDGNAFQYMKDSHADLTDTQRAQLVESSRSAVKANGIAQPGDTFTLNIGEYDGKPGVDYKVTPHGESPDEQEK